MGNFLLEILDDFGLYFLPEKHLPPAYAFSEEKPKKKTGKKQAKKPEKNRLKNHPEFVEENLTPEDGQAVSVFVNDRKVDNTLTDAERRALIAAGHDLQVAAVIKQEKIKPADQKPLSNEAIADKYHKPGRRDGFGLRTVAKIAKIVAPSVGGGA